MESAYGLVEDGDEIFAKFLNTHQNSGEKAKYLQSLSRASGRINSFCGYYNKSLSITSKHKKHTLTHTKEQSVTNYCLWFHINFHMITNQYLAEKYLYQRSFSVIDERFQSKITKVELIVTMKKRSKDQQIHDLIFWAPWSVSDNACTQ